MSVLLYATAVLNMAASGEHDIVQPNPSALIAEELNFAKGGDHSTNNIAGLKSKILQSLYEKQCLDLLIAAGELANESDVPFFVDIVTNRLVASSHQQAAATAIMFVSEGGLDNRSVQLLSDLLEDPTNSASFVPLCFALGFSQSDVALPILLSAMDNTNAGVCQASCIALGELGNGLACSRLRQEYTSRKSKTGDPVTFRAAVALARLGDGSGRSVLKSEAEGSPFEHVTLQALAGLSILGDKDAGKQLREQWIERYEQGNVGMIMPSPSLIVQALMAAGDTDRAEDLLRRIAKHAKLWQGRRFWAAGKLKEIQAGRFKETSSDHP